ncbi:hypothetical protein DFH06DRAFT_676510 [Mycena polygramma]|nr:hypothetical protein DFH06DRAFT_676510 [Mycena polygramma]
MAIEKARTSAYPVDMDIDLDELPMHGEMHGEEQWPPSPPRSSTPVCEPATVDYQRASGLADSEYDLASPDSGTNTDFQAENPNMESNGDTHSSLSQDSGRDMEGILATPDQNLQMELQDVNDGQVVNSDASAHSDSPQSRVHNSSGTHGLCPEDGCVGDFTRDHMVTHTRVHKFKYRSRSGHKQKAVFTRYKDLLFHCQYCHATFASSTLMREHVEAGLPKHYHRWKQPGKNKRLK